MTESCMGASNVVAAYQRYAGKVPATSMQLLAYMAVVSKDEDARPWFGQGHAALAEHALGRPVPLERADIKAVERAMAPLVAAGAVTVDRRGAVRRDGPNTARYRLHLTAPHIPRKTGDVEAESIDQSLVDNGPADAARPPENGAHVPRNSGSHPPENGPTSPGKRGTEEPGGTTRSEKTEEEILDLRTAVTVVRAPPTRCEHLLPTTIRCPACRRRAA